MKKKRTIIVAAVIFAVVIAAGAVTLAVSGYGTSADPLVTLGYVNNVFKPEMLGKIQESASSGAEKAVASSGVSSSESYKVISITQGQKLVGSTGCEILLRSGAATCISSGSGIADNTAGMNIVSGASLYKDHLCTVVEDGDGIAAGPGGAKLIVRGAYTVK